MAYEFDTTKASSNLAKHGVSFDAVSGFDWDVAQVEADLRGDEPRLVAVGRIGPQLHVLVFLIRETNMRLISLRKANRKEIDRYEA